MSQRDSGYARKERDCYETPEWVTLALLPHIPKRIIEIYEPAAGSGQMVRALAKSGLLIGADDISEGRDFLECSLDCSRVAIVTNPPYGLAQQFIEKAIGLTFPHGWVAMLLRTDFDHAKTRAHLFSGSSEFAKKLVLLRRIRWFEDSRGSPSFNHAWFIWDWKHDGPPTIAYD